MTTSTFWEICFENRIFIITQRKPEHVETSSRRSNSVLPLQAPDMFQLLRHDGWTQRAHVWKPAECFMPNA